MTAYHITLLSETNDAFIVATQTQMSVVLSETKKAGVIKFAYLQFVSWLFHREK